MIRVWYSLYDRLLQRRALEVAFAKVRRAAGAPGTDGQRVADFEASLGEELDRLAHELQSKSYRPLPVRRVTVPKPGGGERHLGIPADRDRVVQQAFDRVNHDVLMSRVARRVKDKRLLKLIRAFLNSGVLIDGLFSGTPEGTPQGGPLTPPTILQTSGVFWIG